VLLADTRADNAEWRDEYFRLVAAEAALEDSRARYATLYDSAPAGYAMLDGNGCIRDINLTGARILGRTRETLVGGTMLPLVLTQDRRKFLSYLSLLHKPSSSLTAELHFQRPDRSQVLLNLVSESAAVPNGGRSIIRMVFSDVTEHRRTELELNESRAELAAVTASAMDAIISTSEDQRIVQFNGAAEAMFSCYASKAIGQPLARFIPERFREAGQKLLRNFARGHITAGRMGALGQIWGLRANGQEFPIEASISQTEVVGEKRLTLVLRDITERKLAEEEILRLNNELEQRVRDRTAELETANRELQREVAERRQLQRQMLEISEREQRRIGQDLHDGIGQQLTGLMLLNDALLKKLAKKSLNEQADIRRIGELLAQARVQVHQLSRGLHPVTPAPYGLMTALGQLAQNISGLHDVDCRFRCSRSVLLQDNLVATHLFRIAQEAVHNAVRHGRGKHIRLSLTSHNGSVHLTVRDDGRGISQTASAKSRGLGFQIMRSRCEVIGASLTLCPLQPHGTRLECRLPISRAPAVLSKHSEQRNISTTRADRQRIEPAGRVL
jgi:PAS domain S-box-containing protein